MSRDPIIDTHVHFWNMRNPDPGLAWVWLDKDADHPIIGNIDAIKMLAYDINGVWAEARFADVSAFVHVQAAIGSEDPVKETVWLTRMRETAPVPFTIIGDAALASDDAMRQLDGHCESPYFVGIRDFNYAGRMADGRILSCQMYLPMPTHGSSTADFFNPQIRHIERMVLTGRQPYPVERTLLTSGMTLAGVQSLHRGVPVETPEMAVRYSVPNESWFWRD